MLSAASYVKAKARSRGIFLEDLQVAVLLTFFLFPTTDFRFWHLRITRIVSPSERDYNVIMLLLHLRDGARNL